MAVSELTVSIADQIKEYGAPPPIILRGNEHPETINYLDLIQQNEEEINPDAVVEFQGQALLYILDSSHLSQEPERQKNELIKLKLKLANRGDIAYIGVLKPGQLEVFSINLEKDLSAENIVTVYQNSQNFFQSLAHGLYPIRDQEQADFIYNRIFSLINNSANLLIEPPYSLTPDEVLSLIGRALFFRFLKDREIITPKEIKQIYVNLEEFGDCFANAENAALTSAWLDRTFNGDLLPLPENGNLSYFKKIAEKTNGNVFRHLSAIIAGAKPVGDGYQLDLWNDFDFFHIPVGLLSQVYESFSRKWDPLAKKTSVYYTPRNIADYLVNEAFSALSVPHKATILDPAAGAGIFLVLSFRKLVAEYWKAEGKRPDSEIIHRILYQQIRGFDISHNALKLAALSLYLTAIELDPSPYPPQKLRFPKPLLNEVLFNMRKDSDPKEGLVIGSLTEDTAPEHHQKYDIVIGNPPWTKLGKDHEELAKNYTKIIRNIAKRRNLEDIAENYDNPDNNPDLPFVWKSLEWAKPGGMIAFMLPARILFRLSSSGCKARNALFRAVKINGILNCSNLSDTNVWPRMNQGFFMLFASNRIPDNHSMFHFVSPYYEKYLNSKGRFRIDYTTAEPVQLLTIEKEPWLLKTLATGTSLDVSILRKIETKKRISIKSYWENEKLIHSSGYQIKKKQRQLDASQLKNFPHLTKEYIQPFTISTEILPKFQEDELFSPRDTKCYLGPLVLVHQSPGDKRTLGRTIYCKENVVYSETFYGYSGYGHQNGDLLVRYLYLILYSKLIRFYILTQSSKLAVERRTFQKIDIDKFPIIPADELTDEDRKKIFKLSEHLAYHPVKPFSEIDEWLCRLYGLDEHDIQVINDTVEIGFPFQQSRLKAETPPTATQIKDFISYLKNQLSPYFDNADQKIYCDLTTEDVSSTKKEKSPWKFLRISVTKEKNILQKELFFRCMDIANENGASRIIVKDSASLIIGLLNQYRYWTKSRARLCGLDILRNHMDAFPVSKD